VRAAAAAEETELLKQKKRKNADWAKLRRAEVKAAGGKIAYREYRALAEEEALSKLTAEEAELLKQKKRKTADYDTLRNAEVKAAGGKIAYRELCALAEEEALSKLRAQAEEEALSKADYHKLRNAKVKAAGAVRAGRTPIENCAPQRRRKRVPEHYCGKSKYSKAQMKRSKVLGTWLQRC